MKILLVLVAMLMLAVPAFAGNGNGNGNGNGGGNDTPILDGTASVSSAVGGGVLSGNIGTGLSFGYQKSCNLTTAGFGTQQNGNQVTAYTYGSSVGSTFGIAYHGIVGGFQTGTYSATATLSIPKH